MSKREAGELLPGECPKCGGEMEVKPPELSPALSNVMKTVGAQFRVLDFITKENGIEFEISAKNPKTSFKRTVEKLRRIEYVPIMRERNGSLKLLVIKYPKPKSSNPAINILLLCLTCMSTFLAGYFIIFNTVPDAVLFSASLMLMLGVHELGHKIAAWRNGIESTLPYFIPAPNLLGTMGAIINVKSPIPTRESLVEMGVSGPLAGFLVAVPIVFVGLMMSAPDPESVSFFFLPAAFALMEILVFGHIPSAIRLNPLLFAGWVMMLLTMLNLMPAGQLDGGHVARGFMKKETHYSLTMATGFLLFISGLIFPEMPFWFWGLLILFFFRFYHPGALDDVSPVSRKHALIGVAAMVIFVLCLPVPLANP